MLKGIPIIVVVVVIVIGIKEELIFFRKNERIDVGLWDRCSFCLLLMSAWVGGGTKTSFFKCRHGGDPPKTSAYRCRLAGGTLPRRAKPTSRLGGRYHHHDERSRLARLPSPPRRAEPHSPLGRGPPPRRAEPTTPLGGGRGAKTSELTRLGGRHLPGRAEPTSPPRLGAVAPPKRTGPIRKNEAIRNRNSGPEGQNSDSKLPAPHT